MSSLLRVLRYFYPYKRRVILTLLAATGSTVAGLAPPWLWRFVVDQAIPSGRTAMLVGAIALTALALLLRDGLDTLRIRWNNRVEQQVILDLRNDIFGHLQRLSQGFYANRATGELMSRVVEDVSRVERVLLDGTEQMLVAVITLFGAGFIMFLMNPLLALVALIPVPLLAIGALLYTRHMRPLYRRSREAAADMNATLHDSLSGILQVKIFNQEERQAGQFHRRTDAYRKAQLNIMYTWALFSPSMKLLGGIGFILVLLIGGRMWMQGTGNVTAGTLLSFYGYLTLFYEPINRLHALNNMWQDALAASERVFEVLDTLPDVDNPKNPLSLPNRVQGRVTFRNVQFSYDSSRQILHNISLDVQPGEVVALVGSTGAGKSTLVHLIPRFYDVTDGQVTIDGIDVRDVSLRDLREQIALVSQEPFLFNTTIGNNIRMGNWEASEQQVRWAARMANAADFIEALPAGYDTHVGERGIKLSVGEKQRISIARALLKDAPIIILDEATASVDTVTEFQIQEALERLQEGKTTFVIAHRLSTIRDADRIVCIQNGRIVEMGTHDKLLAYGGVYASLVHHQQGKHAVMSSDFT